MSLVDLNQETDITEGSVNVKTNFEILSPTAAAARNISAFVPFASAEDFMKNSSGVDTNVPLSSAFRQITNYFFFVFSGRLATSF